MNKIFKFLGGIGHQKPTNTSKELYKYNMHMLF
jgi:hypothetical protein